MTKGMRPHSRGAIRPGLAIIALRKMARAQGMPGVLHTRSLACGLKKAHEQTHHGLPKQSGIPCAMVYGLYVRSPVYRAC
jgi:hypothetical protein